MSRACRLDREKKQKALAKDLIELGALSHVQGADDSEDDDSDEVPRDALALELAALIHNRSDGSSSVRSRTSRAEATAADVTPTEMAMAINRAIPTHEGQLRLTKMNFTASTIVTTSEAPCKPKRATYALYKRRHRQKKRIANALETNGSNTIMKSFAKAAPAQNKASSLI